AMDRIAMDSITSDLYKTLNVNKNATKEEIRSAYRKLVLTYHPDKNKSPDALEKFRKIQMAYETLMNDQKRTKYDAFDNMNNSSTLKNMFAYYYESVLEKCQEYEISYEEKEEIIGLFNPN